MLHKVILDTKNDNVNVRLDKDVAARLASDASELGVTQNLLINMILRTHYGIMSAEEKVKQRLREINTPLPHPNKVVPQPIALQVVGERKEIKLNMGTVETLEDES